MGQSVPNHTVPPEHQAHSQQGRAQGYHHAARKSPYQKWVGKHFSYQIHDLSSLCMCSFTVWHPAVGLHLPCSFSWKKWPAAWLFI